MEVLLQLVQSQIAGATQVIPARTEARAPAALPEPTSRYPVQARVQLVDQVNIQQQQDHGLIAHVLQTPARLAVVALH